jgi:hypothetical protein
VDGVDGEKKEDADQPEQDLADHRAHGAGEVEACAELSAIARPKLWPETISGTMACQAGAFMALPRPMQKVKRQQVPV